MSHREESLREDLAKLFDATSIAASLLLLTLLIVASINRTCTIGALLVILPLLIVSRNFFAPHLTTGNFYVSWAATSYAILVGTFQLEVVPYLEIVVYENAIVTLFAGFALLFAILVRRGAPHFPVRSQVIASSSVPRCYVTWRKSSVNSKNRSYFFLGCAFAICALLYGAQLMATTICHPATFNDMMLLPDDCTDVYHDR